MLDYQKLSPPTAEDEDNIVAALEQSGRVSSINLTVTSSLLERLSSIKRPFSELEDLVLRSRDGVLLTLPSGFRWGPRLRRLHSTGIAIPGLLQLYSSTNLVDLQLREVFHPLYFSPEVLTDALSGMAQLQSLSLHFISTADIVLPDWGRSHFISTADYAIVFPGWGRRAVLPVLSRLYFRGVSWHLERLVTGIDAPRLGDIELTILNENIIGFPKLGEFVDRIEMHKSHRRAHILFSDRAISISLIQPGTPARFKMQLFCEPPSEQLLLMTRICAHLSAASLINVEDLRISVKWFHLDSDHSTNIVRDLRLSDRRHETMLPSLHKLYIPQPGKRHVPLEEAVVSFMISRWLSGRHLAVEYELPCHINELHGTGPPSRQVTIEMLYDDILLNIFRNYLDVAPRTWPTLTYVCQRWRQIVHTSPLGLNLRLYYLDPPSPEDDDNIMAALKRSGRVNSISLTATSSLVGKLSAISEPFSELEELVLLSRDNMQLSLPNIGESPPCKLALIMIN
ncbi:hypothetical protein EDB83DRAFT_2555505 [Lactarius deliciosus]|nr:hypothetical protein EDB83DRAFT_2555505 [Lactarius deliciosus]